MSLPFEYDQLTVGEFGGTTPTRAQAPIPSFRQMAKAVSSSLLSLQERATCQGEIMLAVRPLGASSVNSKDRGAVAVPPEIKVSRKSPVVPR